MFSQLFPYSLLFNLSTGYILTISYVFRRYFGPYHRNFNEIAVIFQQSRDKFSNIFTAIQLIFLVPQELFILYFNETKIKHCGLNCR